MEKFFKLFKRNFKTARLEMRILEPTKENAKLVWDALKNESAKDFQYIKFSPQYDKSLPESATEVLSILKNENKMANQNGVVWYVFYKNKLVGYLRIHYWESNKTLQFAAVWFIKSVWGNGFNREIHDTVERIAFEKLHVHRTARQCMAPNIRSKKSIMHAGYHLDGTMRDSILMPDGTWVDHLNFTKLETEYKQR